MKEENQNGKERQMAEEQIDFRTLLFKYIIHWPWFVGAVLLCLVGAWFYPLRNGLLRLQDNRRS